LQTFFAVSHDSASGRLVLEDDRIALTWPDVNNEPVYARLDAALEALATGVGASYVKNPLALTMMGSQPATAHPLGGCGMGRDRGEGVVNHKCQVFAAEPGAGATDVHEGLYVVDGSIMPRSLGVNPLLTITALAERAMLHLARDSGFTSDDAPRPRSLPVPARTPGGNPTLDAAHGRATTAISSHASDTRQQR
jgi:cholesterol oxidase